MCNCFGTYISSHTIVNLKNKTLWSITKFFALGQNSKSCFNISMQLRLGPSPSLPLSYFLSLSLSFTPSHCAFLSLSFLLRSSLIYSLLMPLSHSLSCFLSLSLPLSHLLPYSLVPLYHSLYLMRSFPSENGLLTSLAVGCACFNGPSCIWLLSSWFRGHMVPRKEKNGFSFLKRFWNFFFIQTMRTVKIRIKRIHVSALTSL